MSSGLTLYQARTSLPTAALASSKASSAAAAAPDINAACSWIMNNGKWVGTMQKAVFSIYDSVQITLPRSMFTVQAAVLQGTGDQYRMWGRFNVTNEWYQWIPGGPGFISNPPWNTAAFTSLGAGFVFFRDLPSTGTIKVYNTTTETAGTINIRGYDFSGQKVFTLAGASRIEGENLAQATTANTAVTTATTWNSGNSVYGVVKPTTNGQLLFYHVAADATETLIGQYDPSETNPDYRRYAVPKTCIQNGQVVALCKRAFVPVVVDNDQIVPGNLKALEFLLMAQNFQRKADKALSDAYLANAMSQLNSEVDDFNAEQSLPVLQIDQSCGMSPWDNTV